MKYTICTLVSLLFLNFANGQDERVWLSTSNDSFKHQRYFIKSLTLKTENTELKYYEGRYWWFDGFKIESDLYDAEIVTHFGDTIYQQIDLTNSNGNIDLTNYYEEIYSNEEFEQLIKNNDFIKFYTTEPIIEGYSHDGRALESYFSYKYNMGALEISTINNMEGIIGLMLVSFEMDTSTTNYLLELLNSQCPDKEEKHKKHLKQIESSRFFAFESDGKYIRMALI